MSYRNTMDPNKTLESLLTNIEAMRQTIRVVLDESYGSNEGRLDAALTGVDKELVAVLDEGNDIATNTAALFDALADWIRRGGFKPMTEERMAKLVAKSRG